MRLDAAVHAIEGPDAARGSIPQQPSRRKRLPAGGPHELIEAIELRARDLDFVETLSHGLSGVTPRARTASAVRRE